MAVLPVSLLASAAVGADRFWVGGTSLWQNQFAWSSTSGGSSGAGAPTSSDIARFHNLTNPFTANFNGNGVAHQVVVRNSSGDLDLGGSQLSLARMLVGQPPNTAFVDSIFFVGTNSALDTAKVTLNDGIGFSNLLHATGFGETVITIAPDFQWTVTASDGAATPQPNVHISGSQAEILVQGRLDVNEFSRQPSVLINNGARLTVSDGIFGNQGRLLIGNLNSGGTFTVSNNGLAGINDEFVAGDIGAGRVDLRTGGNLTTQSLVTLGRGTAGIGHATVTNALTNWFFEEDMILGDAGVGTLQVTSGGNVRSFHSADTFLGFQSGGRGRLTISGGGTFGSGGSLYIGGSDTGQAGTGMVQVQAGGNLDIGGRIHVWNDRHFFVDGGTVNAGSITMANLGLLRLTDGGVINADAMQLATFAPNVNLIDGEINITGGTLDTGVTSFSYGEHSTPVTIRLLDGARSDVSDWTVGTATGGRGITEVQRSGAGGGIFSNLDVFVGGVSDAAIGTLNITDGGRVRANDDVSIGRGPGSDGNVLVSGIGGDGRRSTLQSIASLSPADGEIVVGTEGNGQLDIRDGGLAQAFNSVSIASRAGGKGTVTVGGTELGTKATLSATDELAVGGFAQNGTAGGDGLLDVLADGLVTVGGRTTVYDGGVVDVREFGTFESDEMAIDGGRFTVFGPATVEPPGPDGTSAGIVDIDGATTVTGPGARLRILNGIFRTGSLDLGGVPSRLEWSSGELELTNSALTIGIGGPLGSGVTLGPTQSLDVSGPVFIGDQGAVTLVGGQLESGGQITVEDGSDISGHGTLRASAGVINSGTLRPGSSGASASGPDGGAGTGEISIVGTYTQAASTGALHIDFDSNSNDRVRVFQSASLAGELIVSTIDDFVPLPGDSYQIMTYSSRTGTFDSIANQTGRAGLIITPDYGATALNLLMDGTGGDANLDGAVNLQDFNILAGNFGASGVNWLMADFNGDSTVNLTDFNILAGNFGMTFGPELTPDDWATLAAAVPEPSGVSVALLGAALLASRRRRARSAAPRRSDDGT